MLDWVAVLTACTPIGAVVGAGATAGTAVVQERGAVQVARDTATQLAINKALIENARANVLQRETMLKQAQIELERTRIRSPIDGVVISRDMNVGQTVQASMQAPTLFIIAADLTKMQVSANIDEADSKFGHEAFTSRATTSAPRRASSKA